MDRCKRENLYFGAKLVRGAYMVQERRRALEEGYESPIMPDKAASDDNYNKCMDYVFDNMEMSELMIASHNEQSTRYAIDRMAAMNIPRRGEAPYRGKLLTVRGIMLIYLLFSADPHKAGMAVYFGQLLGMCDHVSYSLGAAGYNVYKYMPYGPIMQVMPYLIRRAEENSDMLGGVAKEKKMLRSEIRRRILARFGFTTTAKGLPSAAKV